MVALPLPEMEAVLLPPLPPCAVLVDEPELPLLAFPWPLPVLPPPPPQVLASPEFPDLAWLLASPPSPAVWVIV